MKKVVCMIAIAAISFGAISAYASPLQTRQDSTKTKKGAKKMKKDSSKTWKDSSKTNKDTIKM